MKKKSRTSRRFGARYGRTVRKRLTSIEVEMKKEHECPQCNTSAVVRKSVGLWKCRKCGYTFTGGAYVPVTKMGEASKRRARSTRSA